MRNLERNRQILILFFIALLAIMVVLSGYIGDRAIEAQRSIDKMEADLRTVSGDFKDMVLLTQTAELRFLEESWHNWNWDYTAGDWTQMHDRFIQRAVFARRGPDLNRMQVVYNEDAGVLYYNGISEECLEAISGVLDAQRNFLYPSFLYIEGNYWNKITIPTPTSKFPRLTILYGFSGEELFSSMETKIEDLIESSNKVSISLSHIFFFIAFGIVFVGFIGLMISMNIRLVEREVLRLKALYGRGWDE